MTEALLTGLLFLLAAAVTARVRSAKLRTGVLALISWCFYLSWGSWFLGILLFSTAGNYLFGLWLRKSLARSALLAGVSFNLALLGAFKYLPPIGTRLPFSSLQVFSHIALPLGISFWTFQAMSYLFDLYREEELDPSFLEFALYMAFFPVVISGPICRLPDMLPQFRSDRLTKWNDFGRGLGRIATGVLMMQLAKLLGQGILSGDGINGGFDRVAHWGGADVWCLAFGYGLQLFFDFAGYSHIAIGAAQALGIAVPENFARPFASTTPSVFWTRWHMSLSFWIRDYLFLPMAVMRREMWWRNLMLVVSMVAFGVWHKASILFVLWGCYHGLLLVLHRQVQQLERRFDWNPPEKAWGVASWIVTITFISLGWILFRANSTAQASEMFLAVVSPASYAVRYLSGSLYLLVGALAVGYGLVLLAVEAIEGYAAEPGVEPKSGNAVVGLIARSRWYWVPALYALLLLFVWMVTSTQSGGVGQLMYRQF